MTQLLDQTFAAAARLPAEDQDALASVLLGDLASEREVYHHAEADEEADPPV